MELFGLGTPELLLILFVLLLFFGKDKLPDLARSIGRSIKELKNGFTESVSADTDSSKAKPAGKKS
jgi:sec-independent protein translocase protein TatA